MNQDFQVHQYVDAPEPPPVIGLCMDTVARVYGADVRVLRRHEFVEEHKATEGFAPAWANWLPCHRNDYVRAYTLFHHGGAWVDSNVLLMRALDGLYGLTAAYDMVGYAESPVARMWETDVMFARPRSWVAECIWNSVRVFGDGRTPIGNPWTLGRSLVSGMLPLVMGKRPVLKLGAYYLRPVPWKDAPWRMARLADDAEHALHVRADAVAYTLADSGYGLGEAIRSVLLESATFIGHLFRRALG